MTTTLYRQIYTTPTPPLFTPVPQDVFVAASGDLAALRGTFTMTVSGPHGTPVIAHGKYLETWRRDPTAAHYSPWRLVTGAWNLDAEMS